MIEIKDITLKYGKRIILNKITYKLDNGKHILIGPNGSGKTSLIKCILGIIDCEGSIYREQVKCCATNLIDVYKIINLKVNDIIKIFSNIYQIKYENILSALNVFKMGYILKNNINKLSTGESKILGVSIAMNLNCDYIFLDEPFEGIDASRKKTLIDILNENKINFILITHELEIIKKIHFDSISLMFNGKIFGPYKDVNLDELYINRTKRNNLLDTISLGSKEYYLSKFDGEYPLMSFKNIDDLLEVEE